jgi:hypothetical protein
MHHAVPASSDTAQFANRGTQSVYNAYVGLTNKSETVSVAGIRLGSTRATGVPQIIIYGTLTTGTLSYTTTATGAVGRTGISINAGGLFDITQAIEAASTLVGETITISGKGIGTSPGAILELGSESVGQTLTNLTFNFSNSLGRVQNQGTIEFATYTPGLTLQEHVGSVAWGDTILFKGADFSGDTFDYDGATHTLEIMQGATPVVTFSNLTGSNLRSASFQFVGNDAFTVICYARGTMIRTPAGEVPVERLRPGVLVTTLAGDVEMPRPVRWVGHRRIGVAAHPRPHTVAPVRIARDAFADTMPQRDLLVSPDHAIFVDGRLICARQLVNGTTIRQETDWTAVDYYHVELDTHAILMAEGLPAESYIDTGNRDFFTNSGLPIVLHPDLTDAASYPTREAGSCAPFASDEARVRPVWQRLAERAAALGRPVTHHATTAEGNLMLRAKGRDIRPIHSDGDLVVFALPRGAAEVRLISRAEPANRARPWLEDRRTLGVRVSRIVLRGADHVLDVPVDHPGLHKGWWAVERDGSRLLRWTDGDAVVPLPSMPDMAVLEIHLGGAMTYVLDEERRAAA